MLDMDTNATLMQQVRNRRDLPPPPLRRAIRQAAGVSTEAVAGALGVTRQAVEAWERGVRSPSARYLTAYADLLHDLQEATR